MHSNDIHMNINTIERSNNRFIVMIIDRPNMINIAPKTLKLPKKTMHRNCTYGTCFPKIFYQN